VAASDGAEEAKVAQGPDGDGLVGGSGREEGGVWVRSGLPGAGYGRGGEGCERREGWWCGWGSFGGHGGKTVAGWKVTGYGGERGGNPKRGPDVNAR
jgi:hypothetical protein